MPKLTPKDAALAQLTNFGVPPPDKWLPKLEFFSALFFLEEAAKAVQMSAVVFFGEMAQAGDEVDDTAAEVMNGIARAMAGSVHALVALELLPATAEEAMEKAVQ